MEIRDLVDQHCKVAKFLTLYATQLARQGSIVSTWRRRGDRKLGPYYLLVCRDAEGRQHSVYLGPAGAQVDETREALAQLQAPLVEQRQLAQVLKQLQVGLAQARHELDHELQQVGLFRKGSEIRGWSHAPGTARESSSKEIVHMASNAER